MNSINARMPQFAGHLIQERSDLTPQRCSTHMRRAVLSACFCIGVLGGFGASPAAAATLISITGGADAGPVVQADPGFNNLRNALFVNASTSTNKTSVVRLINLSNQAGAITGTAYDETGNAVGTANAALGTAAAYQTLSFTSAQLEAALGYSPSSPTAKYRIVFNANLPSVELINFIKDVATGNLILGQSQIDNRPAATASTSTRNMLLENASTSGNKTSVVRLINLSSQSGAITATAYDEAGNLVGTANASLGMLGAQQMLTFTSAQLESALGFTPSSGTAKYRIVFTGALPSFEVINYVKDSATGNLTLGQAQTDNRTAGSAASSVRNALFVNASTSGNKTSVLRLINPGSAGGNLTATAYDEAGNSVGSANAALGTIAARQMLTFTSAQLEAAIGYTPASDTAKYRIVFSANLPELELLNFIKDNASGNLTLGQAQIDDSSVVGASASSRDALYVNPSIGSKTSVVRLINPGSQSGSISATAYSEAGSTVGTVNAALGSIAARQMLSFTSAQLEAAIGYTPESDAARYRIAFNANLPAFELINFVKDTASGTLTLAQMQTDVAPPLTTAAPALSATPGDTTASVNVTINQNGTGYYLVLPAASAAPSVAAVSAGTPVAMSAGTPAVISLTGLSPSTAYVLYFVAKNTAGNYQGTLGSVAITTSAASSAAIDGASWIDLSDVNAAGTYPLALAAQPTGNVTVSLSGDAQVDVSPTSITFTPQDWNQPRTVTVSAKSDNVSEGQHTATVNHAIVSGSGTLTADAKSVLLSDEIEGLSEAQRTMPTYSASSAASFGDLIVAVGDASNASLDAVKTSPFNPVSALQQKLNEIFGNGYVTAEMTLSSPPTFTITFNHAPLGRSGREVNGSLSAAVDKNNNQVTLSFQNLSVTSPADANTGAEATQTTFNGSIVLTGTGSGTPSSIVANVSISNTKGQSSTLVTVNNFSVSFVSLGNMVLNGEATVTTSKGTVTISLLSLTINRDTQYPTSGQVRIAIGEYTIYVQFNGTDEVAITIFHNGHSVSFNWHLPDMTKNYVLGRHRGGARAVSWHPDGKLLASVGLDGMLKVWNTSSTRLYWLRPDPNKTALAAVAWSPDGKTIASANLGGVVSVADVSDPSSLKWKNLDSTANLGTDSNKLAWSPDSTYLAGAGNDGMIRIWLFQNGRLSLQKQLNTALPGTSARALSVAWSPDGKTIASGNNAGRVLYWDVSQGPAQASLRATLTSMSEVNDMLFASDGKLVATDDATRLNVYDGSSGALLASGGPPFTVTTPTGVETYPVLGFLTVAVCWDNMHASTGASDSYGKVGWSMTLGSVVSLISFPSTLHNGDDTQSLRYAPNGGTNRLASASSDETIRLWPSNCPAK